jgi:ribonuclease Y
MTIYIAISIASVVLGIGFGYLISLKVTKSKIEEAEESAGRILKSAEREAETRLREAALESKDKQLLIKAEFEKETKDRAAELSNLEKRLTQKEQNLDKKTEFLEKRDGENNRREKEILGRERLLTEKEEKCEKRQKEQMQQIEKISGMSAEEAKKQLMGSMEQEAKFESAKMIKRIEDEAKDSAEKKAKHIITEAIQRYSSDYTSEVTISVVNLPSDDMKGRIIGREGRNIRALESCTGIDLIIDDTPGAVIISGFDPIRREVARVSLERLMTDGRIHPAKIEEIVEKVKKDIDKTMREEADKLLFDIGISDLNTELVNLLGRLKYRTSYAQNNLSHTREVAFLCGIMAAELGLDIKLAKRAAILHDIGKAVDHQEEGSHPSIGAELARRYGESPKVVNAIAAHHGDIEPISTEAVLVAAADALSAARPGARRESLESYIKRLERLENLAASFKGVEKAYAIQAGREVRVIIKQGEVSDAESAQIARELAKKIQQELTYPGQIKITVIRENRYIEYAK